MVRLSWKIYIGLAFIAAPVMLAGLHILVFHDPRTLLFYLALDIVFVPIQVLLVSIIIEKLLGERERQSFLNKLNMVIGAFFSEVGADLLKTIDIFNNDKAELAGHFAINTNWTAKDYKASAKYAGSRNYDIAPTTEHFMALRAFLIDKKVFMLSLLGNANLLEHESFTDLLWAVTHLMDELAAREDFDSLPPNDIAHLKGDIHRAYRLLLKEWLAYMKHLQEKYPYLFSLAVRSNPFKPISPIIP